MNTLPNSNTSLPTFGSGDGGVYTDLSGLQKIKQLNKQEGAGEEALQAIAQQFESVFISMMMKSMREANEAFKDEEMSGSNEMNFYQQMFDQQLGLTLSNGGGMGLSDALLRQLQQSLPQNQPQLSQNQPQRQPSQAGQVSSSGDNPFLQAALQTATSKAAQATGVDPDKGVFVDQQDFVQRLSPLAQKAAQQLGVDSRYLLSQAALETGWGQHVMTDTEGRNSFNLFGIKVGANWQGRVAVVETLEYRDGLPVREKAHFRAYDSYADSFQDYARFVGEQPRYQQAVSVAADAPRYVRELQRAGYATDPDYADKIINIVSRNFAAATPAERG